jgi:hypothetical protein
MTDIHRALPFDVLHLGFPKTASTYLQTVGLRAHPEIDLSWRDHKSIFFDLRDYSVGFDKSAFLDQLAATPISDATPRATCRVFSAEALSGDAFDGRGARLILEQIAALFPGVKAFIVIREQRSYVLSVWNAYVQEGGPLSLRGFLTQPSSPAVSHNIPRGIVGRDGYLNIFEKLRYADYVKLARETLGPENFGVFFYEDMLQDRVRFFADLYGFIGVSTDYSPESVRTNVRFERPWLSLLRALNHVCQTKHNGAGVLPYSVYLRARRYSRALSHRFPSARGPRRDRVDRHLPGGVAESWRESNRLLAEITGRNLAALGYDITPENNRESGITKAADKRIQMGGTT